MLAHLRRNAVAYLALLVALSTGTAYAAGLAKNSVGTAQLKKNAVTSPKIKNGTIKTPDLKAGVLPQAEEVYLTTSVEGVPAQNPDSLNQAVQTLPTNFPGGRVHIRIFAKATWITCDPAGTGFAAMYVDGSPIVGTNQSLPVASGSARPLEISAVIDLSPGGHDIRLGFNCPSGSFTSSGSFNPSVTTTLLAR